MGVRMRGLVTKSRALVTHRRGGWSRSCAIAGRAFALPVVVRGPDDAQARPPPRQGQGPARAPIAVCGPNTAPPRRGLGDVAGPFRPPSGGPWLQSVAW